MYQKIIVIGRLGRDPEMRYTPAGQSVTSFSIATDRQYNGADGKPVKITTWFRVQVWSKMAEACNQYLSKGKLVMVEGILNCDPKTGGPRTWAGQDGMMRTSYEITASAVKFLSPRDGGGAAADLQEEPEVNDESIPF